MPGLNFAPPPETVFPDIVPRRTWSYPELCSHALLVLTPDRLYLTPLGNSDSQAIAADSEALPATAKVLDLAVIRHLQLDLLTNTVAIDYAGAGSETCRQVITFATHKAADACFARLWRRLGDKFALAADQSWDTWAKVRGPFLLLVCVLLVVSILVAALSVAEDLGLDRLAAFDWRLVCAFGGVGAAVSQVWLYRRLTTPPVTLELVRS